MSEQILKVGLAEISTYDHFHFIYLSNFLDRLAELVREDNTIPYSDMEWEEVLLENYPEYLRTKGYHIIIHDTVPLIEIMDWATRISPYLRSFYKNGGIVVGIAEGACLATTIDTNMFRDVKPIREDAPTAVLMQPRTPLANLEPVLCRAVYVADNPRSWGQVATVRLVDSNGNRILVRFDTAHHDIIVGFEGDNMEVIARYRIPVPLRNMPGIVRVNRLLLYGFHPEDFQTELFYETLKPLLVK